MLFFGKRAAPLFAVAAIGSLAAIVYLEIEGLVRPTIGPMEFDYLLPMTVLLLVAAAMTWVVMGSLERNLQRVRAADAELRNYD
jgi:hypothetical protein